MPRRLRQFAEAKLAGEAFSILLFIPAVSSQEGAVAALFLFSVWWFVLLSKVIKFREKELVLFSKYILNDAS